MNCSKFEESLSEYLDGLLEPGEAKLFGAHALQCRSCRGLLDEIKAALKDCRDQFDLEPSEALEASLVRIPSEYGMLDCEGFQELVTEFLDGFVPAHTYHRFETHAESCCECSSLLTEVVYAVAACHSVHTYENYEVPEALFNKLQALMPEKRRSLRRAISDRITTWAGYLIPSKTQGAPWSFATASMLAFSTFALLLFSFSDDRTVTGIYRQAHLKAAEFYTQSADIYAQRAEVVARIQEVGSGIEEIWDTLGGTDPNGNPTAKKPAKENQKNESSAPRPKGSNQKH